MLAIFPTYANAVAWSKNRFGPMVDRTAVLAKLIAPTSAKISTGRGFNTVIHKRYPGGWFLAAGSNSSSNLRAHTAKVCIFEEVDGYPASSGDDGDVILLTEQRSVTYPDAFSIKSSSPTLRHASRIESELGLSDCRKWFVSCPGCAHRWVIMWKDFVWDKEVDAKGKTIRHRTETACLECPNCQRSFNDRQRMAMVEKGEWIPTNQVQKTRRGYWANAFITLLKCKRGFKSWAHYWADRFLAAKRLGPTGMRTFQNLILAETYEVEAEKPPEYQSLYARREQYRETAQGDVVLPEKVLYLVAGADVQQDRIEAEVIGVCLDEEIYGIQYKIFRGNTETPALFNELDQWLSRKWKHPSGHQLKPDCACIDAANKPDQIYAYVKRCAPRRIYAIRGVRGYAPNWIVRSQGRNQRLFLLKVDTPKEALYSRLRLIDHGPGFQHFPSNQGLGYDLTYFQQLTAEVMRTTFTAGHVVRYFDVPSGGTRNEALDARVYALAAKEIIDPNFAAIQANLANPPLHDWRTAGGDAEPQEQSVSSPAPESEPIDVLNPGIPLKSAVPPKPRIRMPRVRGWARAF